VHGLPIDLTVEKGGYEMLRHLTKAASGITGLDEITGGGLPVGRATLVCGGPGSGKTLLAITFLAEGAMHHDEPGVLLSFDERIPEIEVNCGALGVDLADLQQRGLLATDYLHIERRDIQETGEYDLEGLFIRLAHAVAKVNARRVVLDGIDTLFAGVPNDAIMRAELRRLLVWLKERDLSTVITAEHGQSTLTRHGIEEYVSDCVIFLEQRVSEEIATRRLRIVKYRGTSHGTNEYPFLIEPAGLSLIPITALGLAHKVSNLRVATGIAGLDTMLEGKGFYQGASILISGGPGSGKTSIGAQFAHAVTSRGMRCLYLTFEESEPQLVRNMLTIGIDLRPMIEQRCLIVSAVRPTSHGLEMHLARIVNIIREMRPDAIVVDPLSALQASSASGQSEIMVLRLVDFIKSAGTTALYLAVHRGLDDTDLNISSLMDTWITVRNTHSDEPPGRRLYIVKSRGMAHSPDVRAFSIGASGVQIAGPRDTS
jgi:circadian clock protein KaiC